MKKRGKFKTSQNAAKHRFGIDPDTSELALLDQLNAERERAKARQQSKLKAEAESTVLEEPASKEKASIASAVMYPSLFKKRKQPRQPLSPRHHPLLRQIKRCSRRQTIAR
ncbi:hypothetical protein [Paenibacillus urinalis]|uniref:Uncharacterized protein n=1 Tax=Paenibacillus urinalis TaxID=521520 RepID=A0AAX3MWB4_9BACL|nr:hypothetical protein [Paenibacillus urinalis]WDH81895.1 hypothetical protein PUW23_20730 [Paenibacillus urinalis]